MKTLPAKPKVINIKKVSKIENEIALTPTKAKEDIAQFFCDNYNTASLMEFFGRAIGSLVEYGELGELQNNEAKKGLYFIGTACTFLMPNLINCANKKEVFELVKKDYFYLTDGEKSEVAIIGKALTNDTIVTKQLRGDHFGELFTNVTNLFILMDKVEDMGRAERLAA